MRARRSPARAKLAWEDGKSALEREDGLARSGGMTSGAHAREKLFPRLGWASGRPLCTEICPSWIDLVDQPALSGSRPPFDLLLTRDCAANVCCLLEIDQTMNPVVPSVPRNRAAPVLQESALQIVGYSDVEPIEPIGQDVDVILSHANMMGLAQAARSVFRLRGCAIPTREYMSSRRS